MQRFLVKIGDAVLSILLAGGISPQTTGTWSRTGNLNQARFNASATLLNNGKVLVFGTQYQLRHAKLIFLSELYDPGAGVWTASGNTKGVRLNNTATLLSGQSAGRWRMFFRMRDLHHE